MKVLIAAAGGPERRDGGGIFLRQVLDGLRDHDVRLVWFAIGKAGRPRVDSEGSVEIPVRGPIRGLGQLRRIHRHLANWAEWRLARPWLARTLVTDAVRLLDRFRPDVVLGIVASIEPILFLRPFCEALDAPLATMEWDPPLSMAHVIDLPSFQLKRVRLAYETLMRSAASVAVTSEGMEAHYRRAFGRSSTILRQYVEPLGHADADARDDERREWLLYLGGNVYAEREFETFLAALDRCGWMLHGKPVRLRWLGPGGRLRAAGPCRIEFLGWQPLDCALSLAAECDMGYVAYWFDPARSLEAETCFPSKMISYVGVGLPSFFHGPETSSPAAFIRRFGTGCVCAERTPEGVLAALEAALGDPWQHQQWRAACREVAKTEFSRATFQTRLNELLERAVTSRASQRAGATIRSF